MPESPSDSPVTAEPAQFWEWVKVIRRARLGFYDSPKKDPKKWVSSKVVQHIALVAVTYGDYPDGTSIRPSVGRLARVCDTDERTVRACLKRLVDLQLFEMVSPHRHPGRGGGEGRPAEYRLLMPIGLLERVAHLDPHEAELVVPVGAEVPPERKTRRKTAGGAPVKPRTAGAAPVVPETPGATRTGSASNPVDNPVSAGAARNESAQEESGTGETPGAAPETAGAARRNDGCSTRPPTQVPNQTPSQNRSSRNHLAELEGSPAERAEPSARRDHLQAVPDLAQCDGCGAVLDPDGTCFACPADYRNRSTP